ncbi:MAG: two-component regulator propeller domain-containing protein [Tannerellaceae bacterium]
MKRIFLFILIAIRSLTASADQGIPFFVNFTSAEYKAHNRNFDVVCDDFGSVYIANFEGVLYYDQSEWRIIHTPGISRITDLFKDSRGKIWVGGYNLFGYLTSSSNGVLRLEFLTSDTDTFFIGEVTNIDETDQKIHIQTSSGHNYTVTGNRLQKTEEETTVSQPSDPYIDGCKINQRLTLKNGWSLLATSGNGLVALDGNGTELFTLSEQNGLCSNNVNRITPDEKGCVWGATDNGLFCINAPSAYSHYTPEEGLKGEVASIHSGAEGLFVGTLQGLFKKEHEKFKPVSSITQACWQLESATDGSLYAATAEGLFQIKGKKIKRLSEVFVLSVLPDHQGGCYTGEQNGIYYNSHSGGRILIDSIEKVTQFMQSEDGILWAKTVFGQVYRKKTNEVKFKQLTTEVNAQMNDIQSLFRGATDICLINKQGLMKWNTKEGKFNVVKKRTNKDILVFPQFTYLDEARRLWMTDNKGENLSVYANESKLKEYDEALGPLRDLTVRAMDIDGTDIWIGEANGLLHWQSAVSDAGLAQPSQVFIRTVRLGNDSIVWGGYQNGDTLNAQLPFTYLNLDSDSRNIEFTFSSDHASIFGKTTYCYRLDGYSDWSAWSEETAIRFVNLSYGSYTFQVMACDKYGRITEPVSLQFSISAPIYLRSYSLIGYVVLLIILVGFIIRLRMHRLLKEKMRLEEVIEQRTSQLMQRNEEIEEKSRNLEVALTDLGKAQNELIRQEKMATVGSLTKGLIDRILNPMNYINNFSHLTQELIKDISNNLEDEKENMTPDNYEDTIDLLGMTCSNLKKIEEHGIILPVF